MRAYIVAVALLTAAMAAGACGAGGERREYVLKGQILSVAPDQKEASIKHEDIPNFMPAMTMPYKVRDPKEFANLQPGDLISAKLIVVTNDAYLEEVRKVGEAALEAPPGTDAAPPPASSGFELLEANQAVPDAPFVDQDGRPRRFASFKGSTVVLTFIYTSCPVPTFCPLMDRHFTSIQRSLQRDPALADVHLVSISFDPVTDTPQVLKKHAAALGADHARWTFLTGERDEIDRFASRFGVTISRDAKDPVNIAHNLRTAIVDAEGRLVKAYTGNEWTPDQILADLKSGASAD
jgi:protein SCO1/2